MAVGLGSSNGTEDRSLDDHTGRKYEREEVKRPKEGPYHAEVRTEGETAWEAAGEAGVRPVP